MKFQIAGQEVVVHVDDYIPVRSGWNSEQCAHTGSNSCDYPVYAKSTKPGEIWPMIAEKAWAKLVGSYAAIEGGSTSWVMNHLTNDPNETY